MTPEEYVSIAREWLNTPFRHQGRVKGHGVDCLGLVYCTGIEAGLVPESMALPAYSREPDGRRLREGLESVLKPVPLAEIQTGDILLIRFIRHPQHVAIYTDTDTIIHSYEGVGKCVEHRFDFRWKTRVVAAYRYEAFT